MFRDGLIYRGNRIVTGKVELRTTVSTTRLPRGARAFLTDQYGPFQSRLAERDNSAHALRASGRSPLPAIHRRGARHPWPKGPRIAWGGADPELSRSSARVCRVAWTRAQFIDRHRERHGLPRNRVTAKGAHAPGAGPYPVSHQPVPRGVRRVSRKRGAVEKKLPAERGL